MNRRAFMGGVAAGAIAVATLGPRAATAAEWVLDMAAKYKAPTGTPYPLVALPTKKLMGQVYDLPPNYETPMHKLIGDKNYPNTDNEYYYVRYREPMPAQIAAEDWVLKITGDAISTPLELTLDDLRGYPEVTRVVVGECTGLGRGLLRPPVPGLPWTKGDVSCGEWSGASLKPILEDAGISDDAKFVAFRSGANTIAGIPGEDKKRPYLRVYKPESVLTDDAMLAYRMNGEDLNVWNGYPVRLVVPGTYAPSWVKQLVEIEVSTKEFPLEWSGREIGPGWLKTYSLLSSPPDGTRVLVDTEAEVVGIAWDHGQGIETVEISVDEGKSWEPAELEDPVDTFAWRVFRHKVRVEKEGPLRILSKATSTDGSTQPVQVPQEVFDNGGRQNNAAETFAQLLVGVTV